MCVKATGFTGNLSEAAQRREWLKQKYKLKDVSFLLVEQLADSATSVDLSAKTLGKLAFVFADELDDHDCWLKPFGIDQNLERYATVIRRLRTAGYNTVHVVTDHGSFYWDPAPDEKDTPKPEGDIRFASRRANHPGPAQRLRSGPFCSHAVSVMTGTSSSPCGFRR